MGMHPPSGRKMVLTVGEDTPIAYKLVATLALAAPSCCVTAYIADAVRATAIVSRDGT